MEKTRTFTMTSYVVYMLAKNFKCKGLTCKGVVGNELRKLKVYDFYPQLRLSNTSHYNWVNDAFFMYIVRILQGDLHIRLLLDAMELVKKYDSWFIQF